MRALLRAAGGLRWALSPGRRPGRAALLSVALFGTWRGWLDFMCVYAWFRWADDRIDCRERGGPEIQAFVREQSRLLEGLLEGLPGGADQPGADQPGSGAPAQALALALRPPIPPALARSVRGMWAALCADAARGGEPVEERLLLTQIRRVGDAYTEALLHACGAGGAGAPPAVYALARAATAVHHLRDLTVDREIGYLNVPLPWAALLGIDPARFTGADVGEIARWRAPLIRAGFAEGAAALPGLPWRARWLLRLFAWRYGRLLERCVRSGV